MNQQPDHFLRFVQGNQTMECPVMIGGFHPKNMDTCQRCNSTGSVPRPEAVELWEALTSRCQHCPGRVPRSPAEQHVALEEWLHRQNLAFGYERDWWVVETPKLASPRDYAAILPEAAKAALVASGWAALGEAGKGRGIAEALKQGKPLGSAAEAVKAVKELMVVTTQCWEVMEGRGGSLLSQEVGA